MLLGGAAGLFGRAEPRARRRRRTPFQGLCRTSSNFRLRRRRRATSTATAFDDLAIGTPYYNIAPRHVRRREQVECSTAALSAMASTVRAPATGRSRALSRALRSHRGLRADLVPQELVSRSFGTGERGRVVLPGFGFAAGGTRPASARQQVAHAGDPRSVSPRPASPNASRRRCASGTRSSRASIPARSAVASVAGGCSRTPRPGRRVSPPGRARRHGTRSPRGRGRSPLPNPPGRSRAAAGWRLRAHAALPRARRALPPPARAGGRQRPGRVAPRSLARRAASSAAVVPTRTSSAGVELRAAAIEERDGVIRARGSRGEKRERFGKGGVRFRHAAELTQRLGEIGQRPGEPTALRLAKDLAPPRDGAVRRGRDGHAASRCRRGCRG